MGVNWGWPPIPNRHTLGTGWAIEGSSRSQIRPTPNLVCHTLTTGAHSALGSRLELSLLQNNKARRYRESGSFISPIPAQIFLNAC